MVIRPNITTVNDSRSASVSASTRETSASFAAVHWAACSSGVRAFQVSQIGWNASIRRRLGAGHARLDHQREDLRAAAQVGQHVGDRPFLGIGLLAQSVGVEPGDDGGQAVVGGADGAHPRRRVGCVSHGPRSYGRPRRAVEGNRARGRHAAVGQAEHLVNGAGIDRAVGDQQHRPARRPRPAGRWSARRRSPRRGARRARRGSPPGSRRAAPGPARGAAAGRRTAGRRARRPGCSGPAAASRPRRAAGRGRARRAARSAVASGLASRRLASRVESKTCASCSHSPTTVRSSSAGSSVRECPRPPRVTVPARVVEEAQQHHGEGRLARPRRADDRDPRPGRDVEARRRAARRGPASTRR